MARIAAMLPLLHRPSLPIEKNPEQATRSAPGRLSQICRHVTAIREYGSPDREPDKTDEISNSSAMPEKSLRFKKNRAHGRNGFVKTKPHQHADAETFNRGGRNPQSYSPSDTSAGRVLQSRTKSNPMIRPDAMKVNLRSKRKM